MAKHSVNEGTGRLFSARKSGFRVSALYRIKPLLQNISHPEPGDFRGLQEIEVSPARGNITSPEGTKVGEDPPAEIPGSPGTGVYQTAKILMSPLSPICSLLRRSVAKRTTLYKW